MMEMYQIVTSYDGLKFVVENKDDEQVLNVSEYSCIKAIRSLSSPEIEKFLGSKGYFWLYITENTPESSHSSAGG